MEGECTFEVNETGSVMRGAYKWPNGNQGEWTAVRQDPKAADGPPASFAGTWLTGRGAVRVRADGRQGGGEVRVRRAGRHRRDGQGPTDDAPVEGTHVRGHGLDRAGEGQEVVGGRHAAQRERRVRDALRAAARRPRAQAEAEGGGDRRRADHEHADVPRADAGRLDPGQAGPVRADPPRQQHDREVVRADDRLGLAGPREAVRAPRHRRRDVRRVEQARRADVQLHVRQLRGEEHVQGVPRAPIARVPPSSRRPWTSSGGSSGSARCSWEGTARAATSPTAWR